MHQNVIIYGFLMFSGAIEGEYFDILTLNKFSIFTECFNFNFEQVICNCSI